MNKTRQHHAVSKRHSKPSPKTSHKKAAPSLTKRPLSTTTTIARTIKPTTFSTKTTSPLTSRSTPAPFFLGHKQSPQQLFTPFNFKSRYFSSQSNDPQVVETEHISAQQDDGEYVNVDDPDDGQERLPFTIKDALLIKDVLIDSLKHDEGVQASLKHLGTANINAMMKQNQIENIVGSGTLSVIQNLAMDGSITLPDIGTGTLAAQNFNTLYQLLQIQDNTGVLKQKQDELYALLFNYAFGTEDVISHGVKISESAAIKIAQQYLDAVSTEDFYNDVQERMLKYPLPAGGASPLQMKLAHEMRQFELTNAVSPILEKIYANYQYYGAEGYCLMKKAMEDHATNPEVVTILNKAQEVIVEAANLDQHLILEN